ncbi:hypothetical protein BD769DRAFT_1667792 [Suillus cothurnatus]|jgi:hypothetical protein|nr:hypothetical protein BD769DRAFT_1667792 [Suillus cothurnatus]
MGLGRAWAGLGWADKFSSTPLLSYLEIHDSVPKLIFLSFCATTVPPVASNLPRDPLNVSLFSQWAQRWFYATFVLPLSSSPSTQAAGRFGDVGAHFGALTHVTERLFTLKTPFLLPTAWTDSGTAIGGTFSCIGQALATGPS